LRETRFQLRKFRKSDTKLIYITIREAGQQRADEVAHLIATLPIHIVPADLDLAKQAAIFKSSKRMSYADCFAAALAKHRKVELVTGDKEFKEVEKDVKILWL
jgi:predicted nucleic acid-binding protein